MNVAVMALAGQPLLGSLQPSLSCRAVSTTTLCRAVSRKASSADLSHPFLTLQIYPGFVQIFLQGGLGQLAGWCPLRISCWPQGSCSFHSYSALPSFLNVSGCFHLKLWLAHIKHALREEAWLAQTHHLLSFAPIAGATSQHKRK